MEIQAGESSAAEPRKNTAGHGGSARRGPTKEVRARVLAFVAAIILLVVYSTQVEPVWIEVTHLRVAAPVSPAIKIAHLTDLHTRELGLPERRLLALLDEEKPDLIVITGDAVHNEATIAETRPLLERLHAPLGVWMVRGNWEVWRLTDDTGAFLRSLGIHFLMNESAQLRDGLWLVGIDDPCSGQPNVKRALASVPRGAYSITLMHAPFFINRLASRTNLVLAGHTHGGQVRIPFMKPLWLPYGAGDYVEGWYELGGTQMYVSRGIGMSILPIRFFCRPELTIITLGKDQLGEASTSSK